MRCTTKQDLDRLGASWRAQGCVVLNRRGTRIADLTSILGFSDGELHIAARVVAAAPDLYNACTMLASLPRDNLFVRQYPTIWETIRDAVAKAEGERYETQD
jgi:hypothetical protein